MSRYALIQDNTVINVVLWDGETEYNPEGTLSLLDDTKSVDPGWSYVNGEFVAPVEENTEED